MLRYCHLVWSNKKKGQGPLKGPFKGPLDADKRAKQITSPFIVKDGKKLIKMLKFWSFLPVLSLLEHLGAP